MTLYTIIMEHAGGTYTSQVVATDIGSGLRLWARGNFEAGNEPLAAEQWRDLESQLVREEAVAVTGVENVWCATGLAAGQLVLITAVATEQGASRTGEGNPVQVFPDAGKSVDRWLGTVDVSGVAIRTEIREYDDGVPERFVIIEGQRAALEFVAELLKRHANGVGDCHCSLSPVGAGCAFFRKGSTVGLSIHRLPCEHGEL